MRRGTFVYGICSGDPVTIGIESVTRQTCQHCAHFVDDPASIEAEFPYLSVFGSAYSSARGHAGICLELDRFMDPVPASGCPSFVARGRAGEEPLIRDVGSATSQVGGEDVAQ